MMIKTFLFLFIFPYIFASNLQEVESSKSGEKKPRLFYVYTLKSTSTVNTATTCYVSTTTAATACTKRKKRAYVDTTDVDFEIAPSEIAKVEDSFDNIDDNIDELEPTLESEEKNFRQEKVLLYWLTTTSLSTKFSYTQTFSVASIACTPSGWTITKC